MSNPLAIAAVTQTLYTMLHDGFTSAAFSDLTHITGVEVTTRPLDKARDPARLGNQVNIFLYATASNAAWRNQDLPDRVKSGETAFPPLALDLDYLLTAYGEGDNDFQGHKLLGYAMAILHASPVLSPATIQGALPEGDLGHQVERVRITPHTLSPEEMSKLWTTFQTQYRISAGYRVAVVLIESARPGRAPLPVLQRGEADTGVAVQSGLIPPYPALEEIMIPGKRPAAHLGDTLALIGHHLAGDEVTVLLNHPLLPDPRELDPLGGSGPTQITVQLPDTEPVGNPWPAGLYTVSVKVRRGSREMSTNAFPLALAPEIISPLPLEVARVNGEATIVFTCRPQVLPEQRAALLLGDREVNAGHHPAPTASLTFEVPEAPVGEHYVRLRVNGVDSQLIDYDTRPPSFLNKKVIIS